MTQPPTCKVIHGDILDVLATFPDNHFNAVITDPPYASGSLTNSGRLASSHKKYNGSRTVNPLPDFEGESMDQRIWIRWTIQWLREAKRVCKKGAPILCFIDWRQLGALQECFMLSGWINRGVIVWDKGPATRPNPGKFKQQTEFICWASKGDMRFNRDLPSYPGLYSVPTLNVDKRHQTEKPLALMRELVKIVPPNSLILDPFAGSGTTLIAAKQVGHNSIGIEISSEYAKIAQKRVDAVNSQQLLPMQPNIKLNGTEDSPLYKFMETSV
jgi:site-specific DNA-methyltransferase (adenine-specific)